MGGTVPGGPRGRAGVDRPIRVLSLIKGLGPGGAEQLLVSAAKTRDRSRVEHDVAYLLPWKDALVQTLRDLDVGVHCLDAPEPRDVRWLRRFGRLLNERGIDVVHVHSPLPAVFARPFLRALPRSRRPAVVSSEHNVWSSHDHVTRIANAATFVLGDAWIAVSDDVKASIPERLRRRVEVIVHGLVLDEARERRRERDEVRRELGIEPDDVVICTVANLRRQKAYPDLLVAAKAVLERAPHARFLAVGQGPLEEEIRALHAELGLGDRFTLLGYRPDALRILAGSDIFALSSHFEGYPIAVMEAMAVGLPTVATAVGGVPEAIEDGVDGLLVPPNRPDLLADRLVELVLDAERRTAMGASAAGRADRYDVTDAVRRTEDIYARVVSGRPR